MKYMLEQIVAVDAWVYHSHAMRGATVVGRHIMYAGALCIQTMATCIIISMMDGESLHTYGTYLLTGGISSVSPYCTHWPHMAWHDYL